MMPVPPPAEEADRPAASGAESIQIPPDLTDVNARFPR